MKKYLVTFDLTTNEDNDRAEDYESAEEYLQEFELYEKPMRNTYLIVDKDDNSAGTIRDKLKSLFKKGDKVLVVQVNGDWAWLNCEQSKKDALKELLDK